MNATRIFLDLVSIVKTRQEEIRSLGGSVSEQMAVRCDLGGYDKATREGIRREADSLYDLLEKQCKENKIDMLTCVYGQMVTHSIVFSTY